METPKISVIVPVYKVEPYLRKCLDSIVNQTYQNLEIILVDDGSPDACGAICDEYAARDGRIRVIHKENGGLSSARNAGLDVATGEYVGFVDSDDWIEADMYEYLLSGGQQEGADITVCGMIEEYPDRQYIRSWPQGETYDREEGLRELLVREKYSHSAWDKLYRRTLFAGVRYPEGRNFEDIATTHRVFERAERVRLLPQAKYHYLQRPDSIMGDGSLRNRVDSYLAAKEQYVRMKDAWPQFRELLEAWCVMSAVSVWGNWLSASREDRKVYRGQVEEMAAFSREHPTAIAAAKRSLGKAGRAVAPLTRYSRWWAYVLAGAWNWSYAKRHHHPL